MQQNTVWPPSQDDEIIVLTRQRLGGAVPMSLKNVRVEFDMYFVFVSVQYLFIHVRCVTTANTVKRYVQYMYLKFETALYRYDTGM